MSAWAVKRQFSIFAIVVTFFVIIGLTLFLIYRPRPSCLDAVQNQDELGVDCGGICTQNVCPSEVSPLSVRWARPLYVRPGVYDIVGLLDNKNRNFGADKVSYEYQIFDSEGRLITHGENTTYANPGGSSQTTLIYLPNVAVADRSPNQVAIRLTNTHWQRLTAETSPFITAESTFTQNPQPRVRVLLKNESLDTYRNVEVGTILSRTDRNAVAGSRSFIPVIAGGETKELFFTWPEFLPEFASSTPIIEVYPRVNLFDE